MRAIVMPHSGSVVMGGWSYTTFTHSNGKVYLHRHMMTSLYNARKEWGDRAVEVTGIKRGNLENALKAIKVARELWDKTHLTNTNWSKIAGVCKTPMYRIKDRESPWRYST